MLSGDIKKIGNSSTKSGRVVSIFSVPCPLCKGNRIIKRQQHAINHKNKPCKKCSNKNNHPQGEYKGIRISWWNKYQLSASYRNITWQLTIEDGIEILERQQWRCILTGIDLICSGNLNEINASLDRIDSEKGYDKKNVQFVHKDINMMRGTLPVNRFIELCEMVADRVNW